MFIQTPPTIFPLTTGLIIKQAFWGPYETERSRFCSTYAMVEQTNDSIITLKKVHEKDEPNNWVLGSELEFEVDQCHWIYSMYRVVEDPNLIRIITLQFL